MRGSCRCCNMLLHNCLWAAARRGALVSVKVQPRPRARSRICAPSGEGPAIAIAPAQPRTTSPHSRPRGILLLPVLLRPSQPPPPRPKMSFLSEWWVPPIMAEPAAAPTAASAIFAVLLPFRRTLAQREPTRPLSPLWLQVAQPARVLWLVLQECQDSVPGKAARAHGLHGLPPQRWPSPNLCAPPSRRAGPPSHTLTPPRHTPPTARTQPARAGRSRTWCPSRWVAPVRDAQVHRILGVQMEERLMHGSCQEADAVDAGVLVLQHQLVHGLLHPRHHIQVIAAAQADARHGCWCRELAGRQCADGSWRDGADAGFRADVADWLMCCLCALFVPRPRLRSLGLHGKHEVNAPPPSHALQTPSASPPTACCAITARHTGVTDSGQLILRAQLLAAESRAACMSSTVKDTFHCL